MNKLLNMRHNRYGPNFDAQDMDPMKTANADMARTAHGNVAGNGNICNCD